MNRSTKRSSLYEKDGQGAYGIRTRATAVRGRRPRPLDECAVPRQGSRSGLDRGGAEPSRQWRPGVLRPNAEPPFLPESSAVLPERGVSRECSGTVSHMPAVRQANEVENFLVQISGWEPGAVQERPPRRGRGLPPARPVSLAGPRWKPRPSQNRLPARIRRAPDGGPDLDEGRAGGETWPRPAGSATFLRPSRAAIVLRRGSPIS